MTVGVRDFARGACWVFISRGGVLVFIPPLPERVARRSSSMENHYRWVSVHVWEEATVGNTESSRGLL
jgi:hypothetical protein